METGEKDIAPRIEAIESESRRYPRFDVHLPIEYSQSKSFIAHTGNISEGGFLIYSPEEKDVNQYLNLKLFFSSGSELDAIKAVVKVVWRDSPLRKDAEDYPCGVKFVDLSPEDGTKLRNLLRSLSSPLDDMLYLFSAVKMRLWKLMNFTGVIATEKMVESVFSQREKKTKQNHSSAQTAHS